MSAAALYVGDVGHVRLRPRVHRLRYRVFYMLLDLDDVPRTRWFSAGGRNLLSFRATDHGDGSPTPLRDQIDAQCRTIGVDLAGGRVQLLTMPRVLGFAFNPLSVYFCTAADGRLAALVHEVNNTFGERHFYVLPVAGDGPRIEQRCAKTFHVSPFMDMALDYRFTVTPPGERVGIAIAVGDRDGALLTAHFAGKRVGLSDRAILACVAQHPLLALKVVGGIHWEALRLWIKGVRLRPHPARQSGLSPDPAVPGRAGSREGVDG
jgi:DUF1365 family protein